MREQEEAQKDEAHEKDNEASEGERSELLQFSADLFSKEVDATARTETGEERLWADVYLEGSYTHLADFFSRLKQQPRLTEVVAWRYVLPRDGVPSNIRVRLNVLYYVDGTHSATDFAFLAGTEHSGRQRSADSCPPRRAANGRERRPRVPAKARTVRFSSLTPLSRMMIRIHCPVPVGARIGNSRR